MRNPKISDNFHIYYNNNKLWKGSRWLNIPIWKLPFDMQIIQELICKRQPKFIVETGTAYGGSALFYASLFDLMRTDGQVITIDIDNEKIKSVRYKNYHHLWSKITFLHGNSISEDIYTTVEKAIGTKSCFFILDSWHTKSHVLKELELYSKFIQLGDYLIVEDTHVNGNPVEWEWGDGPMEAVQEFIQNNDNFIIDEECNKYIMSFNPNGYLKRVK